MLRVDGKATRGDMEGMWTDWSEVEHMFQTFKVCQLLWTPCDICFLFCGCGRGFRRIKLGPVLRTKKWSTRKKSDITCSIMWKMPGGDRANGLGLGGASMLFSSVTF